MTVLELERMARRGAEDGYDDEWHKTLTASARVLVSMQQNADEARMTMNNEQLLQQIINELSEIRKLLAGRAAPVAAAPAFKAAPAADDEVPQPTEIIESPENVAVHFGKNDGVPLGSLGERSVAWYAKEPEPKLDRNGKPFPPRAADVRLRNAARTLIHRKRGTLAAGIPQTKVDAAPAGGFEDTDVNF